MKYRFVIWSPSLCTDQFKARIRLIRNEAPRCCIDDIKITTRDCINANGMSTGIDMIILDITTPKSKEYIRGILDYIIDADFQEISDNIFPK